jgi:hypothetical protein
LQALVTNQTVTKMPQLKTGDKYFAVWEAGDGVLVPDSPDLKQELYDIKNPESIPAATATFKTKNIKPASAAQIS